MQVFPSAVYLLCLATSLLCTFLLYRSYRRSGAKLLLWTALCFVGLALNNLFLSIDVLLFPDVQLLPLRHLSSLAAIVVLLYGFVWEAD
jgi:hypothetical protein